MIIFKSLQLTMFDMFHDLNRIIRQIHNQVRVSPQSFVPVAEQRLGYFHENLYFSKDLPNLGIVTLEGTTAVQDLIIYLQSAKPVGELMPSLALQVAAYRHSQDLANNPQLMDHTGSDGTNAEQRVADYGRWEGHLIEHILFGFKDPTEILTHMLIDDGLPSRATRRNMLNKGLKQFGIGICPHPLYGFVCVILYAKSIQDYQDILSQNQVAQILYARQLA